jgi:hypothetical protein
MAATTGTLHDLLRPQQTHDNVGAWRWAVRRQLVPVRDRLVHERSHHRHEAWISERAARTLRERDALLARLNRLASQVLVAPDVESLRSDLSRLLADIDRHSQRMSDLAYDEVELEIGGSE